MQEGEVGRDKFSLHKHNFPTLVKWLYNLSSTDPTENELPSLQLCAAFCPFQLTAPVPALQMPPCGGILGASTGMKTRERWDYVFYLTQEVLWIPR